MWRIINICLVTSDEDKSVVSVHSVKRFYTHNIHFIYVDDLGGGLLLMISLPLLLKLHTYHFYNTLKPFGKFFYADI